MKLSDLDFHSFPNRDKLIIKLATSITAQLSAGILLNGRASLAVSGGSTPVQLFRHLSSIVFPWDKVDISLVDERWVPPDHPDSNEHLVKTQLLKNNAQAAVFIGMKNSAPTPSEGEKECNKQLERIHRPFDVLLLGMGNDGHTASLFPNAAKLPQATDLTSDKICVAIAPLHTPHERMTLTLPVILESKQLFLHIVGDQKLNVLEQALADGSMEKMPIRYVLRNTVQKNTNTNFKVFWAE